LADKVLVATEITRRSGSDRVRDSASATGMKRSLLVCFLHQALAVALPACVHAMPIEIMLEIPKLLL
jgi:hypothetical protein